MRNFSKNYETTTFYPITMNDLPAKAKVELGYLPIVNFAMQQNRVAVIRELSIENLSDDTLKGIKVTLTTEPEFGVAIPLPIEAISPKEMVRTEPISLNLSAAYFAQLTERYSGSITLEVHQEAQSIFKQSYPIDILAYDQWGGIRILPEMISAFITPNHPVITPIIKRAATILQQWTGNPSLDEYQSRNPDRVQKQMAAIYAAIAEQSIIYSTVPASFEEYGQRVRLVDSVLSQKLGTCLDMALLYASCLEAIGIHALIVVVNGHAFAGGWLIPDTFPDNVIDDVSLLTKRTAEGINDITLVETTCMNMGQSADFDRAVRAANAKLTPSNFILAVDVKRSRFSGIKPIPQRILNGQYWEIKEDDKPPIDKSQATPQSVNPYDLSGISKEVVVTKQLLWERKLLDLSLRNNLLNIRLTKNTLQLIPASLDLFEDALADGDEFRIMHKPTDWDNPLYNFGIYHSIIDTDPIIDLVKSELTQKRLRSYLSENDLGKALTHLYRSSRTAMEENGANTLYLALGLLKWYETKASERPRYAPILLIPVEIIRKSAAKGYVIRSREEDTMMNITLLEMLRQNFNINISGLDPLPTDQSGVDVRLIFSIIRNGIKNQAKWDVEEQAILGIFSFNKFIMWNDIHHNSHKLAKNEVVSSLMNGKIEWNVDAEMADASVLDKHLSPAEIVLPIGADSSQLEAIYEAANGKNFILHGPPGTGKSQTITNIIANALYRGKRILFVAEKMAALSVVQRRLEAIGLAPFCLELHSNKTKKTTILSQLKETSEVVKHLPPENFRQEAERLLALRSELNVHTEALHKTYPFGLSIYEAITSYLLIDSNILFNIPQSYLAELSKDTVMQWREAIETIVRTANACGHPHSHPLTGITISGYSSAVKDDAAKNLSSTIKLLLKIKASLKILEKLLGQSGTHGKQAIELQSKVIERLLQIPELTPALLTQPRLNEVLDEYREICSHGKERDKLKQHIVSSFSDDVLTIDAKPLLASWNEASGKWFLPKYFGQKKVRKQLNAYALKKAESESVKSILSEIIKYKEEKDYIAMHGDSFPSLFGKYGRKEYEDWQTIAQIADDAELINKLILGYTKDITAAARVKNALAEHLPEGIAPFKSIHGSSLTELNGLLSDLLKQEEYLSKTFGISIDELYTDSGSWIDSALSKLNIWLANINKLKDWYQWLLVHEKMCSLNIGFVADEYKAKNIETAKLLDVFNKSFYKAAINFILSKEPSLELFKGKIFTEVIERYKQLTTQFEELAKKELFAKLAANLPSFTREAAQNSEVGILQRNIRNNARGTSIRKLFDQIPTLLSRMCPCMLMSPISVAQYIDTDADKFDLVIFDEASQMPTYEAVGAIARGKNIVIVGDPKQMPPTSFFMTNAVDEDNIELEDLESILDDCLALSMPSKHLLWHYRSKHESLIAFSNTEYYDNKLLTFPSSDNIESKVRLVAIEGFYDKGKSRQNKTEAQAVVNEVVKRLQDDRSRKKSIGVVTFSAVQQALIEDLLSDIFAQNPELEVLALECEEPLFIKNLENVQGDERDVILFSVGYGPDSAGQVSMNFGPLNRQGGERRLNVAVSRARYEMVIYSTLRSDQIDLNRTSAVGVAGLKRFLEYAERGERIVRSRQSFDSPKASIHSVIAGKLETLGYAVHTDIGCSGYKIDIGIVDTDNPSRYKLGIICDGENYKRTKTVRDREIVQNNVLRLLGWNIYRIWTLDWWENPDEVIATICDEVNKERAEPASPAKVENPIKPPNYSSSSEQKQVLEKGKHSNAQPYAIASLYPVRYSSEDFFNSGHKQLLLEQIKTIAETEAPISRSLLCKKVLSLWGISRLGQRLNNYFDTLLEECCYHQSVHEDLKFFWKDEQQYLSYCIYRTNSNRDAVDLPPEEVANGVKQILENEISLPTTDLSRICAQLFGFARSGSNVDAAMHRGVKEAIRRGFIRVESGRAIIV